MSQATLPPAIDRDSESEARQRHWVTSPLFGLLQSTNRVKTFLETTSSGFRGVAALLLLAVIAVFTDAALALSPAGRIIVDVILIGSLCAALAISIAHIFRNRFNPQQTARVLEERMNVTNSLFVNGVDFASAPGRNDSPQLRERTVRMADERAASISSLDVFPFTPLYKAIGVAGLATVAVLSTYFMAPRVYGMVVPRLLDPTGDHPPFTLVEFNVEITPDPIYHGRPAAITATLDGPERIEQAAVVFLGEGEDERVPMYPGEERQFVLQIEQAAQSRQFYIDTPRGRSQTMTLKVLEIPFIEEVRVAYEYPAYTGWSGQQHRLDGRGLRALEGTKITVAATSNIPLQGGQLILEATGEDATSQATVALTPHPAEPNTVSGTFPIEFSGRFELSIVSHKSVPSLEAVDGPLTVVPDRNPDVVIVSPGPYVVAVENWQVPVTIEAVDDVGISRMRLFRSVNGWGPNDVDVDFVQPQPNTARAQTEFDLPALGAGAGDLITYYVSAYDNHPSGRQFEDSETHTIQVISEEEYRQYARQQYQMEEMIAEFEAIREQLDELQQQREELLDELEELRKEMEASPEPTEEMLQKMEQLEEQLQQFSENAETLAKRLDERAEQLELYEVEEPYLEMLRKLSDQLQQQSESASNVGESMQQMREQPLETLRKEEFLDAEQQFREENEPFSEQSQETLDSAAQDMELYQMADSLLSAADRMRSIISRQRELADRFGEIGDTESLTPDQQDRADRLAKEQELLEQDLQQTMQQMREAAEAAQERLPEMSQSALELCDKLGSMGVAEDQQTAASEARAGSGRLAHEAAESAAQKLESLQGECSNCQGAAEGMCDKLDGPLSLSQQRLEQCLNQLAQGRGIPGLGNKPGSGQGQQPGQSGMGGMNGQNGQPGSGQGQMPMWRPGQSFPGSQAAITVLGPHTMTEQMRESPSGRLGGDDRGRWIPFGTDEAPFGAESLNPETRDSTHSSAGQLRGVPVPYRDAAEAYFKRLAEER